ncbi:MAG: hypothetical protein M1335_01275, partial [Chloroflexi bacterium]|nr:hypothetical protein [Chloroflexota bacterium]
MAITINAGRTFLICEDSGDITREEQGLYCSDTRWLNKYILTINGERPGVLLGGSPEYFSSVHYLTTKPEREKREIEAGSISIVRRREVNDGLRESIDISNFDSTACS